MQYVRYFGVFPDFSLKRRTLAFMPGAATRMSIVCLARKCSRPLNGLALTTFRVPDLPRLAVRLLNGHRLPEQTILTVPPAGRLRTSICAIRNLEPLNDHVNGTREETVRILAGGTGRGTTE